MRARRKKFNAKKEISLPFDYQKTPNEYKIELTVIKQKIKGAKFIMTTENDSNENQKNEDQAENKSNDAAETNDKNAVSESGDPGRTPGSAEGDEETVDEDIRQKEAEGKL